MDTEFKDVCDSCKENKKSRIFWTQVEGKWVHLCKDCWEVVNKRILGNEGSRKSS